MLLDDSVKKLPRRAFGRTALAATAASAPALARASAPASRVAIVLNSRDASVSLIDQASLREVGRVEVGKEPHHLYPMPDNSALIVANAVSDDLHFLDPSTGRVLGRLRNIDDPYQLAFSPDTKWFVTAALRLDRVDVYAWDGREKRLVRQIPLARAPSHLWFSADSRSTCPRRPWPGRCGSAGSLRASWSRPTAAT
jgi:hypothetical protein